jgi:hypothetical protein
MDTLLYVQSYSSLATPDVRCRQVGKWSNTTSHTRQSVNLDGTAHCVYPMRPVVPMRGILCVVCGLMIPNHVVAFTVTQLAVRPFHGVSLGAKRCVLVKEKPFFHGHDADEKVLPTFDPFNISSEDYVDNASTKRAALSFVAAAVPLTSLASNAIAVSSRDLISAGDLNPKNFDPVCPASDAFYRGLQGGTQAIVGDEAFVQYGPLIAGGLLRIRLELCVVESFFNEAVVPFIEKNGVSWILPFHETVETFLAGVIFSLASTFILVGTTKIISVIITYADLFLGLPLRILAGFFFDRARGKPVTLDIRVGPFKTRLFGPDAVEETLVQGNKGLFALLIIVVSGFFKFVGEISGVS